MKKVAKVAVGLLFLPALAATATAKATATATATATGAWSQRGAGINLSVGRQAYPGRWIIAPHDLPPAAVATRLAWHITLLNPAGPDLQIDVCQETKCLALTALSGQIPVGNFFTPYGRYRFVFSVARPGRLYPPVQVVAQQLTLNYRR